MKPVVLAVLALVASCVDSGPGPQPRVDAKYARAHLLEAAPADLQKVDVTVGDKAIYLGNKIDRARLAPGQSVVIKHYWKVLKPIGNSYRPFALVRGPPGTPDFMNLEPSDMQIAHPLAQWKPGEIIEDEQTLTIRPDWGSPYAFLYVGFIEVGKHGTLDRMAVTPATSERTQDRAIIAAKLEIDLSRAPPPPGTIHIPRASGPIVVDGQQIDQGWSNAITSPELVTADGSPEPSGKATAKLVWDDFYLYLFLSIVDTDVTSPYKTHDDSLWKADAVEIFIDADGNRAGYIELQVNPHNTTFDSWFAGPRGPAGDVSWDSGMVTAVKVRGTPDGGDTDQGWDVEIGIPWSAIRGRDANMPVTLPPRIGDRWKLNVVRVDVKSGNDRQSASSWNRIGYGDWHALDKMLTAVFADPTGSTVPTPENPTTPPGIAPPPGTPPSIGAGSGSATVPGGGSATVPGAGSSKAGSASPSVPATSPSNPATGSSKPATNPTNPTSPSNPATGSSKPATGSSKPATNPSSPSNPATGSSKSATNPTKPPNPSPPSTPPPPSTPTPGSAR